MSRESHDNENMKKLNGGGEKKKNQSKVKMSHDSEREWTEPHSSTSRLLLDSQVTYVQVEVRSHLVTHVCSKLQPDSCLQNKNTQEEEEVSQKKGAGFVETHRAHYE